MGRTLHSLRILSQILFTVFFFVLLLSEGKADSGALGVKNFYFHIDPLVLVTDLINTGQLRTVLLLSLLPVAMTLLLGRFFCGWTCPLGAINHFFSFLAGKSIRKKRALPKNLLQAKYVVLIVVVVSALLGTRCGMVLDPSSLLTRSTATILGPAVGNALAKTGIRQHAVRDQFEIVGVVFVALLVLNFYKRRFFCNYVCPLGALYGLLARTSRLSFSHNQDCTHCGSCSEYCTYNGNLCDGYSKNDCTLCFNCLKNCPTKSANVKLFRTSDIPPGRIDITRRKVLGAMASGIFVSALPGVSGAGKRRRRYMRPPGTVDERTFLDRCIRCGMCVQACPYSFIQPAALEAGVEAIWTPVVDARTGYCEYECNRCTSVCPTNAIETLTLNEKKEFRIGMAVVDRSRCYTYGDGFNCTVCADACPIPEKAIRFREVEVGNFKGRQAKVNQIFVDPDLCNGCGLCEYVCPRTDAAGIILTPDNEQREFGV